MITIKKIEIQDFLSIAEEWNTFLEKSSNNNIFLTYEWLSSWWKAFKTDTRAFYFLIARDADDHIVGGFPFQIITLRLGRFLKFRHLLSVGRGGYGAPEAEYNTFMMPPTLPSLGKKVYSAVADYLESHGEEWDLISLTNLLPGHISTPILEMEFKKVFKVKRFPQTNNYVINLSATYESFLKGLSRNQRRNLKRKTKRIQRDYEVRLEIITKEDEIEVYLKDYYLLVRQRHHWTPSSAKEAFMISLCRNLARRGWMRSYMLFLNNVPSATLLGFAYNHKYYGYKAAHNSDFFAVSPGTALFAYVIQNEIEQGVRELDYLIGEYDYKQYWCNEVRYIDFFRVQSGSLKSRLKVYFIEKFLNVSRSIRRLRKFLKRIIDPSLINSLLRLKLKK